MVLSQRVGNDGYDGRTAWEQLSPGCYQATVYAAYLKWSIIHIPSCYLSSMKVALKLLDEQRSRTYTSLDTIKGAVSLVVNDSISIAKIGLTLKGKLQQEGGSYTLMELTIV
jgi:hypothetical protein